MMRVFDYLAVRTPLQIQTIVASEKMTDVSNTLHAAVEIIFWADTRTGMLEALQEAAAPLLALRAEDFGDEASRRELRYIQEIAQEYEGVEGFYSSDVRNEVREALAMVLALYRRESLR